MILLLMYPKYKKFSKDHESSTKIPNMLGGILVNGVKMMSTRLVGTGKDRVIAFFAKLPHMSMSMSG